MANTPRHVSVRQKNIVNPYAQGGLPEGYSLSDSRNKWVIAGIHDSYLSFGYFPSVDTPLVVVENSPLNENNRVITQNDLKAYLSLYPQNGKLSESGNEIRLKSVQDSYKNFEDLVRKLNDDKKLSFYTSPSSPEAQKPQNQKAISSNDATATEVLAQNVSQLVAIPYDHGRLKLNTLRETFSNPLYSNQQPPQEAVADPSLDPIPFNPDDVDFEDWRNNVPPGSFISKTYYNFKDGFYYYTQRTNFIVNETYDTGRLDHSQSNIAQAIRVGLQAVLKFSGKYTDVIWDELSRSNSSEIVFIPYKSGRPNSRWIYAVKIPKSFLDNIENTPESLSTYEDNLDPYEKSQLLFDPLKNNTTQHMVFKKEYFLDNLEPLVEVLMYYHDLLKLQGLEDGKLDGVNLKTEVDSVRAMYTDIQNFISLNKIEPEEDHAIDFCLSDNMKINYLVIDGVLYTGFLGQTLFTPVSEDELENQINLSAVNTFSAQTPASIGYWFFTPGRNGIFKKTRGRQRKDWPAWANFLELYHKPTPDIDPENLEDAKKRVSLTNAFLGKAPKPKIFQTLTDITKNSPTPSGNPEFASFLQENLLFLDAEKALDRALAGCETPLSKLVKDVKFFYKWSRGKISTDALIAKAIGELRSQLMEKNIKLFSTPPGEDASPLVKTLRDDIGLPEDPLDPIYVQAAQGNYGNLSKKIEAYIDRTIDCLLPFNDIQATLSKQLRQHGAPPALENLVVNAANPPITVKLRKTPYRKNSYERFWKLIEEYAVRFIKQLILGAIVQMIEALLGCGPEEPGSDPQELARRIELYGFIDINDFISGVDTLRIATSVGLKNKTITFEREGLLNAPTGATVLTSPPRIDQLEQFHNDLSAIITPEEIKSLLNGEGTENLLNIIIEMIEKGNINITELLEKYPEANGQSLRRDRGPDLPPEVIPIGDVSGRGSFAIDNLILNQLPLLGQPELRVITNEFQDSLKAGDLRYASLSFTKEKLVNYFKQIGREMGLATIDSLTTNPPQLPIQSYCPDPQPTFDFLSDEQIKLQLAEEIISAKNKMSDLCEVNDGLFEFDDWWDAIELPEALKKVLEFLRKIGDEINAFLTNLFADDDVLGNEKPARPAERDCADFENTLFWDEVKEETWEDALLGSSLPKQTSGNFSLEAPIELKLVEVSNEELAEFGLDQVQADALKTQLLTWESEVRPSKDEAIALYKERRRSPIAWIVDFNVIPGIDLIADFFPEYDEEEFTFNRIQQIRQNIEESDLISTVLAFFPDEQTTIDSIQNSLIILQLYLNIQRIGSNTVEGFLNFTALGRLFKNKRLRLSIGPDKAVISQGLEPIAESKFWNGPTDEMSIAFRKPLMENFRSEMYPLDGEKPPESPDITLYNIRTDTNEPSEDLLKIINQGRESAGIATIAGEPKEIIPSLTSGWVKEVFSNFLSTFPDDLASGGRAALSSIQHINYRDGRFEEVDGDIERLDFYLQLCQIFYKPQVDAPNPLPAAMRVVNEIPLIETPEKCAEIDLARSMMQVLKLRMSPFLINVLPLMRVYKGFNNPTTLNLLASYLQIKIQKDFINRQLNSIFQENIDTIFSLYEKDLSEGSDFIFDSGQRSFSHGSLPGVSIGDFRFQPDLSQETYDFKLRYIIRKYLISAFEQFDRFSSSRVNVGRYYPTDDASNPLPIPYGDLPRDSEGQPITVPHLWAYYENFYDPKGKSVDLDIPGNTYNNYLNACKLFFNQLATNTNATTSQDDILSELSADGAEDNEEQKRAIFQLGAYYFPAPAMLATYIIAYDAMVKTSDKFYLYRSILDAQKRTDDVLKLIVNPNYIADPERSYLTITGVDVGIDVV